MTIRRIDEILDKTNVLYVMQDEEIYEIEGPSTRFGETKIIWQNGKVARTETTISELFPVIINIR